jgi:hypothetical protein
MDLFVTYYKELLAVIGSLTGLFSLFVTFYIKLRDSNIKDNELELKKIQFESEKYHQIAKETYQKIFEKKLLLYKELYSILNLYNNRLHNVGIEIIFGYKKSEVVTEDEIAVASFNEIITLIEKNIFYLSEIIEAEYKKVNDHYQKALYSFEEDKQLGVYRSYGDDNEIENTALADSNSRFYQKHKDDVKKLFSLIEFEIKQIKKDIGFI